MRRLLLVHVVLCAGLAPAAAPATAITPHAVVALIDTGINPYSPAFRDRSALAQQHPSTYLPGYPPPCEDGGPGGLCSHELRLTLDADSFDAAFEADRAIWEEGVFRNRLYWIPGTRIVGAISLVAGDVDCGNVPTVPPATGTLNGFFCEEYPIHDDHGHGTMTASRAAAVDHSLGAGARIVAIEGLGDAGVTWAANQGWIDVQSNSWGSLAPAAPGGGAIGIAFKRAVEKHLVLTASGNGLAFSGVAPQPTYSQSTMPQGVVIVGAHDNGRAAAWSGAPAHVVTDGYGGWTGLARSIAEPAPAPIACCTSSSSPYAAGGAAAIAMEARRVLGDPRVGVRNGVVAEGPPGLVPGGPLADGVFTLTEWRDVLLATAQARPVEGRDDGLLHFTGGPEAPEHPQHGPGENPFCQLCWTLPLPWTAVPAEAPAYHSIGYGAVNELSVALASAVLNGDVPMPERPMEDEFYAQDQALRRAYFGP